MVCIAPQDKSREDAWTTLGGGPLVARICEVAARKGTLVVTAFKVGVVLLLSNGGGLAPILG